MRRSALTATHWGTYRVTAVDGNLVDVEPWRLDPDPSPIGHSMVEASHGHLRVQRPSIRTGWLHRATGGKGRRGAEPFVEVPWDEALDLVADELDRVRREHCNAAIYAGSYGWASAGRFHHAQSQVHRFLNTVGGYTSSRHTYSYGAAEVILPHVLGSLDGLTGHHSTWDGIAEQGSLIVSFGGMPLRNAQVQAGGLGRHAARAAVLEAARCGATFINLSPVRADAPDGVAAEWVPLRPGTDVAVMLGLAFVLLSENRIDRTFLDRCCVGFDQVRAYVLGETDATPKTPDWAEHISMVPAARLIHLARSMSERRTLITVNWAIQRADYGEQPYWMAVTLACLLGQIGLPGGGFGFGYASTNGAGRADLGFRWPSFPQGRNPVVSGIPVARIADLLARPGEQLEFNGGVITYPDIRLVYWAGGNPFHHHQDLNALTEAWQRPDTIVVHEPFWTSTARRADIVLPVTLPMERDDIALANRDNLMVAMKGIVHPPGEARDDYAVFSDLAARLGTREAFTQGRSVSEWLRALYDEARTGAAATGMDLPPFDAFWEAGSAELHRKIRSETLLGDFRNDPSAYPLETPSGRIELASPTIASFGYDDAPGHAVWREPAEWLGSPLAEALPFHLLTPQPADKLHSQYDHGSVSQDAKIAGRAPLLIHADDAAKLGIRDGDVVEVSNPRGACLAGARVTRDVLPGVVQMPTGAWYDPEDPGRCGSRERHGNPNVLTPDRGTSRLAQGCSCNSTLVRVRCLPSPAPAVEVLLPPEIVPRDCS